MMPMRQKTGRAQGLAWRLARARQTNVQTAGGGGKK